MPDPTAQRARDLVGRNFAPASPDRLWVADIPYISTWSGRVNVAFVTHAYARRILGWRLRDLDEHPARPGLPRTSGADQAARRTVNRFRGGPHRPVEPAQYVSIRYTERLAEAGIAASVGTVGDSYDCETVTDPRAA